MLWERVWELTGEGEGVTWGRGGYKIGLRAGGSGTGGGVLGAGAAGVEGEVAETGVEGVRAVGEVWGEGPPDLPGEQRKQRTQRREELVWPGRVESGEL